jgi:hypothetical protein
MSLCAHSEEFSFSIGALTERGFGTSSYFLDVNDGSYGVQSLLEFPLDSFYAGVEATLAAEEGGWRVNFSALTNLGSPAGLMTDADWDYEIGKIPVPWSYTESNLEYQSLDLRLHLDLPILEHGNLRLYLQGGYRFFLQDQRMTDFEGWQYVLDEEYDPLLDADDTNEYWPVYFQDSRDPIDYRIFYHIVSAGLLLEGDITDSLTFSLSAAPAGGFFFDRDDHLLRSKLSTGRGIGYGFDAGGALELGLTETAGGWTPYLRLSASWSWFFSHGVQDQRWYAGGDQPEGTEFNGLVHDVTLADPRIGLSMGGRFGP